MDHEVKVEYTTAERLEEIAANATIEKVDIKDLSNKARRQIRIAFMHDAMKKPNITKQIARTIWDRALASGNAKLALR